MRSLSSLLITSFCYLFGLTFLWLFINIFFDNNAYSFKMPHVAFYLLCWMLVTAYFYKLISDTENFFLKNEKKILAIWILIVFSLQLYCGYLLAVTTSWDTEAVFHGAINLQQQGNLGNHKEYFHVFPHNLGVTSLLQLLFTIFSAQNTQDYYWIATTYNVISINLGLFFVYLICRELQNIKIALLSLWLGSCCIPFYFYTPIFYSDTISLPFLIISYYLYLLMLRSKTLRQEIFRACLFAVTCAAGALIKFTVVIVAIAALIDLTIRGNIKKYWFAIIVTAGVFYACISTFDYYRYTHILDKHLTEQKQVPYTHWIMMGLSGNGAYNGNDYTYTYSFPTIELRTQANLEKIIERLKDYGFIGYLEFLGRKQQLNFGSGIYGVNEMIDDGPLRPNALHTIALDSGVHHEKFRHIAQGFHIFIFLILTFSALYDGATKASPTKNLAIRLSITGIFIFLALWEGNSRYILNFIPMFIAGAAIGFPEFCRTLGIIKQALRQHIQDTRTANQIRNH